MNKTIKCILSLILSISVIFSVCSVSFAAAPPGDPMVYYVQRWLNQQYGHVSGFGSVTENGKTGTNTINGLIRAMQIELGIKDLADNFGPTSQNLYGKAPLKRQDGVTNNKFAILQGALWCKGYNPGYNINEVNGKIEFNAVFDEKVEEAVNQLKQDAGIEADGIVTTNLMKALLSMDSFKLLPSSYGSNPKIREMQQFLNKNYESFVGLSPCDGVYGRNTNIALIKALQTEEGIPKGSLSSNFGQSTKRCCPELPYIINENAAKKYDTNAYYTDDQIKSFTMLLQYSLMANGFYNGAVDGIYNEETKSSVIKCQQLYKLTENGIANIDVWMALLTSKGNPDRSALACDCATILTDPTATTLYNNGYRYVGRYLTGTYNGGISKAITRKEANLIFEKGLRFFPIYQTTARQSSYFTVKQGELDAQAAYEASQKLGLPKDTIIYFAVDYDCMDYDVRNIIIPYFEAVYNNLTPKGYRVGIYGPRNACSKVSNAGFAVASFVGDMSTGFSGNLGYPIPSNWAFDQFATVSVGSGAGKIEIDKDAFSGIDKGVGSLDPVADYSKYSKGDVNCDNTVNMEDYQVLYDVSIGRHIITDDILNLGDLNLDGAIDSFDAIELQYAIINAE